MNGKNKLHSERWKTRRANRISQGKKRVLLKYTGMRGSLGALGLQGLLGTQRSLDTLSMQGFLGKLGLKGSLRTLVHEDCLVHKICRDCLV